MQWISRWLKPSETADVDALKSQLHSEGFGAYQWKGTPGAAYLDYIHAQEEVVCVLSGRADVSVGDEHGQIQAGDRVDCAGEHLSLHHGDERRAASCANGYASLK